MPTWSLQFLFVVTRPVLFWMDPEMAHWLTIQVLRFSGLIWGCRLWLWVRLARAKAALEAGKEGGMTTVAFLFGLAMGLISGGGLTWMWLTGNAETDRLIKRFDDALRALDR